MKSFNAIHKRNGKSYVVKYMVNKEILVVDVESGSEKLVTESTIKRWYELGQEIIAPKAAVGKIEIVVHRLKCNNGQHISSGRTDKFRPKLTPEQVLEIREKHKKGSKKSHLAKEYNVSFRTITCIVEYLMWKKVV
jgi:hypothetical protein